MPPHNSLNKNFMKSVSCARMMGTEIRFLINFKLKKKKIANLATNITSGTSEQTILQVGQSRMQNWCRNTLLKQLEIKKKKIARWST